MLLCLGACVPGHNDFSDFQDVAPSGWRYADVMTFNPAHDDSIAKGDILLIIRHNNSYPYSNLWLEVEYEATDGRRHNDTINMRVADKYGRWLGKGNATDFQVVDTVARGITHAAGSTVRVRHIMRVDTLTGVDLVGIEFKGID